MSEFFSNPIFGFTLTAIVLIGYQLLFEKAKSPLLSPLVFSLVTIIAFLTLADIPYESYEKGASILSFFMGPAVVSLAIPLYRQFDKLKRHALPILTGIITGVVVSICSGISMSYFFRLKNEVIISIAPQGATSAISMSLSQTLGGDPAMTVAFVNIAGNVGYLFGAGILKKLGVHHPLAKGVALGTASHVMGTTRAFSLGEEEGAMASLSIGLAGVMTSILLPLILSIIKIV